MKLLHTSFLFLLAIIPGCPELSAESLWEPGFDGYLSAPSAAQVGEIVLVQIDTGTSLAFEATSADDKSVTFEFSGGEFGNLFSFLPATRAGGTMSTKGGHDYRLSTEVAARVAQVDPTGQLLLRGTRSFLLENKRETLSISGWVDPAALGPDRQVSFAQMADAQLRFQTFLESAAPTLTRADIQEIVEILQAPAAGAAAAGAAPAGPQSAPAEPIERRTYALEDGKKIELFLSYINRMVDLLFQ